MCLGAKGLEACRRLSRAGAELSVKECLPYCRVSAQVEPAHMFTRHRQPPNLCVSVVLAVAGALQQYSSPSTHHPDLEERELKLASVKKSVQVMRGHCRLRGATGPAR